MPRLDAETAKEMGPLLDYHRTQPHVTFAEHARLLEAEASQAALSKVRIYLDLRYWIFLRDASVGSPQRAIHSALLTVLRKAVTAQKVVCPITDAVFFELFRQGDPERRMQSVRLMDELSGGTVIKNSLDRFYLEVMDFLDSTKVARSLPQVPFPNVWVRPYSFLGTPQLSGWGEKEDLAINKAFLTFMWRRSIEDLLTDTTAPEDDGEQRFATSMNELSLQHRPSMRSFPRVYEAEVWGFIQSAATDVEAVFASHIKRTFPNAPNPSEAERAELRRTSCNVLFHAIRLRKAGITLPLIRIIAGLHAIIRWRKRPFVPQDYSDMYHAAAAIPYCGIFFTERFLKNVCTTPPLDFGKVFDAKIVSDEEEALELVERLA